MTFEVTPIATIHNLRKEIADNFLGNIISEIKLADEFSSEAFDGWKIFFMLK